ncbi:hypothetical protein SDC9_113556 [bioreactor metagenome]|uniref:Uncharacterized protein n=1 Tax=bioreactor metagenome TaxID=1076179 RepID=A0A645BMP7_9ZZZZ
MWDEYNEIGSQITLRVSDDQQNMVIERLKRYVQYSRRDPAPVVRAAGSEIQRVLGQTHADSEPEHRDRSPHAAVTKVRKGDFQNTGGLGVSQNAAPHIL